MSTIQREGCCPWLGGCGSRIRAKWLLLFDACESGFRSKGFGETHNK